MTGLSAGNFGLEKRGGIMPGYVADMVLFNADEVIDRGDYHHPEQISAGIEHVWINGESAFHNGAITGRRSRQVPGARINACRYGLSHGDYLPAQEAMLPIFDRATLFGDAVYDVAGVLDGKLIDFDSHYKRLQRSLGALSIPSPLDRDRLLGAFRKLVQENSLEEGMCMFRLPVGLQTGILSMQMA